MITNFSFFFSRRFHFNILTEVSSLAGHENLARKQEKLHSKFFKARNFKTFFVTTNTEYLCKKNIEDQGSAGYRGKVLAISHVLSTNCFE